MKTAINWWLKLSPKFLQALGVIFLSAYALPIINPNLSPNLESACQWTLGIVWFLFAIDYFARFSVAQDKKHYFRTHLLDFAAVALPVLPLLRAIRALAAITAVTRRTSASRSRNVTASVVVMALATWFVAGLAVTDAERGVQGANIQHVGDGWWWAITTMSTVGYGDEFPISTPGRIVGVALMIMGVALLGTITAALASNFNLARSIETNNDASQSLLIDKELKVKLDLVLKELDSMKSAISDLEKKTR